jgi:TPP-dependent 2-oxoacid decarboxylase
MRFVLNDGGYAVERLIHGKTAIYHDVTVLEYALLAETFGPAFASKESWSCADMWRTGEVAGISTP